jgi:glycerol-3-phosphate dehydrogenase subunit B
MIPSERHVIYDVVVIGAGLAGLMAAAGAASGGAQVGVVSLSPGNLGLWSGLVTGPARRSRDVAEATRFFLEMGETCGLSYRSASSPPGFTLLSPSGRTVTATLAPETMAGGALRNLILPSCPGGLLVAGFSEMVDYPAAIIAAEASAATGLATSHRTLSLGSGVRQGGSPRIARLFDDPQWVRGFVDAARRVLTPEKPWRSSAGPTALRAIAFPPVLGLFAFRQNLALLSASLDCPVFELPALPPSIPGYRFWHFWRHRLEADGQVTFHIGRRVTGARVKDNECLWVTDDLVRFQARAYVLATGGIAGGGLQVTPSAFFSRATRPSGGGEPAVTDPDHTIAPSEPLFDLATTGLDDNWRTWGVRVDRDSRPFPRATLAGEAVNNESDPLPGNGKRTGAAAGVIPRPSRSLSNVFAAGWILGGNVEAPRQALTSIVSGWQAGQRAARRALTARSDGGLDRP